MTARARRCCSPGRRRPRALGHAPRSAMHDASTSSIMAAHAAHFAAVTDLRQGQRRTRPVPGGRSLNQAGGWAHRTQTSRPSLQPRRHPLGRRAPPAGPAGRRSGRGRAGRQLAHRSDVRRHLPGTGQTIAVERRFRRHRGCGGRRHHPRPAAPSHRTRRVGLFPVRAAAHPVGNDLLEGSPAVGARGLYPALWLGQSPTSAGTVGVSPAHRFVGRASEVELSGLPSTRPNRPSRVLYVRRATQASGKRSLLDVVPSYARRAGARSSTWTVDISSVSDDLLRAWGRVVEVPDRPGAIAVPPQWRPNGHTSIAQR